MKNILVLPLIACSFLACSSSDSARKKDAAGAPSGVTPARCQASFDVVQPALVKAWDVEMPPELVGKAKTKLPELKAAFAQECVSSMTAADLACAEGDNSAALEACKKQPEEFQKPCADDAEAMKGQPLMSCKGVALVLDRVGRVWAKDQGIAP
jgi:hypothetical protein